MKAVNEGVLIGDTITVHMNETDIVKTVNVERPNGIRGSYVGD